MRLSLIFLLISFNLNATVEPVAEIILDRFLEDVDSLCKADIKMYDDEVTKQFYQHDIFTRMEAIRFNLELRKKIISDGAIDSQKTLDGYFLNQINWILKYAPIDDYMKKTLTDVQNHLNLHPLNVNSEANAELNHDFSNRGL
jgi:hypothetical protein